MPESHTIGDTTQVAPWQGIVERAAAVGMKVDDFTRALLKLFDTSAVECRTAAIKFRNDILSANERNTRPIRKDRAIITGKAAV
jgi:hypothetical protein